MKSSDLLRIYARSFLIQASWSFERMQTLGFAYAILPALRRLYPDPEEFRSRVQVHMEYFNTQPYMASFILGGAARIEEERASGAGGSAADVSCMKNNLMAPLGGLGDSFFWGALKPLTVMIAIAALMTGVELAPLLFLVLYNCWHLWFRADLLIAGYRSAGDVMTLMSRYRFTRLVRVFKAVSLALVGGMLGTIPIWRPEFKLGVSLPAGVDAAAGLGFAIAAAALLGKGISPVKLVLGLAAACVAAVYAGVVG